MPWHAHVLLAEALSKGGTLVAADPAAAPIALLSPLVVLMTSHPSPQLVPLRGAGTAVRESLAIGKAAIRPVAVASAGLDLGSSEAWTALARKLGAEPDFLLRERGGWIPPGYDVLHSVMPELCVLKTVRDDWAWLLSTAETPSGGRLPTRAQIAEICAATHTRIRLVPADGDTVRLCVDPMACVAEIAQAEARVLAVRGTCRLHWGAPVCLRLPVLSVDPSQIFLELSGPHPQHQPKVSVKTPVRSTRVTHTTQMDRLRIELTLSGLTGPWVDIEITGGRLTIDEVGWILPVEADAAPRDDPLWAYEEPLAAYERRP